MATTSVTRRLTVAFACVMGIVLVGGAVGVYAGERFALDRNLRRELARQSDEIMRLVARPGAVTPATLRDRPDSYVQILDARGRELAATPPLRGREILTDEQLREARQGSHTYQRGSVASRSHLTFRIRTAVVRDGPQRRIVVVAVRRDARDEALRELVGQLAGFAFGALALTVLVGHRLTRATIAPVEQMRRQAHELFRGSARGSLEIPPTRDELAALATTLNELLERAQRTVERERAFSAAASHELRTPLTSLKAELDLALRGERSRDELVAALASARSDAHRLIRLAEDLLLLRTPEVGVADDRVLLADLVSSAVAGRPVRVDVDEAARSAEVVGSSELLERAVANLLDNADRHGAGPVQLTVTTSSGTVQVHVRDAGAGFSPDLLPTAFDQFTRGRSQRSGTGSGLGLSVVAAIAAAHGGTVEARNVPTGGAEVRLDLPLAQAGPG